MLSASELDNLFGFKSDSKFIDYASKGPALPEPSSLASRSIPVLLSQAAISLYSLNFDNFYSKVTT
jgi:hypothetical protein